MNKKGIIKFATSNDHYFWIRLAHRLACTAIFAGEVPVASLVVLNNQLVSFAINAVESYGQATQHAELIALQQAMSKLKQKYLNNCVLYTTLEPCHLCLSAAALVKLPTLYFSAYDLKMGAVDHNGCVGNYFLHQIKIYGGLLEEENRSLLKNFFHCLRALGK